MLCIAMCYGDKPERRFVTGQTTRLTYVSSSMQKTKTLSGVGFPKDAVLEFEETIFMKLIDAWKRGDSSALAEHKKALRPINL